MESDVTTTLSELERKLKELERELESVGRGGDLDTEPAQAGWTPPPEPEPTAAPGPPPPGATPFAASWHGTGERSNPPGPPPVPAYDHAEPLPVTPPPAPWGTAAAPPPAAPSPPASAATPQASPESAPPAAAPPTWPGFAPPPPAAAPPAWPEFAPPPPAAAPPTSPESAPPPPPAAAPPTWPGFAPPPPAAATGLHAQLDELLAFRDRLVRTTDDLVSELSRVLTELGVGAAPDPADTLLSGDVVIEAGPFADLATLAAFERALASVPGVTSVYVRSLDSGRAAIDVRLAGAVALGSALRAVVPVPLTVTDVRDGRLALALAPGG